MCRRQQWFFLFSFWPKLFDFWPKHHFNAYIISAKGELLYQFKYIRNFMADHRHDDFDGIRHHWKKENFASIFSFKHIGNGYGDMVKWNGKGARPKANEEEEGIKKKIPIYSCSVHCSSISTDARKCGRNYKSKSAINMWELCALCVIVKWSSSNGIWLFWIESPIEWKIKSMNAIYCVYIYHLSMVMKANGTI